MHVLNINSIEINVANMVVCSRKYDRLNFQKTEYMIFFIKNATLCPFDTQITL